MNYLVAFKEYVDSKRVENIDHVFLDHGFAEFHVNHMDEHGVQRTKLVIAFPSDIVFSIEETV
jgi:hypothetical protein